MLGGIKMTKEKSVDRVIAKYTFPIQYYRSAQTNESNRMYEIALIQRNENYYITDQERTFDSLDATFELDEPDVLKNLVAIMKNFKVNKTGNEFFIELTEWHPPDDMGEGSEIFEKNETLRKAKYIMYSFISFADSMRVFYV